jgi:hypothetical protein
MNDKAQNFVPIKNIKDGILYMDDGRIKVVLTSSSLNLSLKGEEEQAAIIGQFQGFLNSLDFPVQIHVESRRVDIRPYLLSLEKQQEIIEDDLMKNQIREYRQFIKTFAEKTNIMNKRFFVVIDYEHGENADGTSQSSGGGFMGMLGMGKEKELGAAETEEWRTQLEQKVSVIAGGLSALGLQVNMLGTEELIELFYKIYNPSIDIKSAEATTG